MTEQHLHIIAFDIPAPPNYGGVIDVFYKIRALAELGVKVHLHCFKYNDREIDGIEQYCEVIHLYKRQTGIISLLSNLPYIVYSRRDKKLLSNLLKDAYPILAEGIHTTYYFNHKKLSHRKLFLRAHNVENIYYDNLKMSEKNWFKKIYFKMEAKKLRRYEISLPASVPILGLSNDDCFFFGKTYPNVSYLAAFHANQSIESKPGKGNYILYHGNLAIPENEEAAIFLMTNLNSNLKLIIAGLHPSKKLKSLLRNNIKLKENVSNKELDELIMNAHINIIPSLNNINTGVKIKIINALYKGRFCLISKNLLTVKNLEDVCVIADTVGDMSEMVNELMLQSFSENDVLMRTKYLQKYFSNEVNANKLSQWIYI